MYRIMNQGTPNFRTHFIPTDDVIQGGRQLSKNKENNGLKHVGVTAIDPNRQIVHVTDARGEKLLKYPEFLLVEKVADKPKG